MTTILIAGITGESGFGLALAQELLEYPGAKVRGLMRNLNPTDKQKKEMIAKLRKVGVTLYTGDIKNKDSLQEAVKGCDVVVCSLYGDENTVTQGQMNLIQECKQHHIKCYLPADFGIFIEPSKIKKIPFAQKDAQIREVLKEQELRNFSVTCGFFYEYFVNPAAAYFHQKDKVFQFYGEENDIINLTSVQDCAKYTAACISSPDKWPQSGGYLKVSGEKDLTFGRIIQYINELQLGYKIKNEGTFQDLERNYLNLYRLNPHEANLSELSYNYALQSNPVTDVDNDKFPNIKPQSFKDFLQQEFK